MGSRADDKRYNKPALHPKRFDNYIARPDFVSAEGGMGLSGLAADAFALIYSFSRDGAGEYKGSLNYLAARLGTDKKNAQRVMKRLLEGGLILEVPNRDGVSSNRMTKHYVVNQTSVDKACSEFERYWTERWEEYTRETGEAMPDEDENTPPDQDVPDRGGILPPLSPSSEKTEGADCPLQPEDGVGKMPPNNIVGSCIQVGSQTHPSNETTLPVRREGVEQQSDSGSEPPSACAPNHGNELAAHRVGRMDGNSKTKGKSDFDALVKSSVNRNLLNYSRGLESTWNAYKRLLDANYTADEIANRWAVRQEKAGSVVSDRKYYPQLKRWLEDEGPEGARAMCDKRRSKELKKRNAGMPSAVNPLEGIETDPEFLKLHHRFMQCVNRFGKLIGSAYDEEREKVRQEMQVLQAEKERYEQEYAASHMFCRSENEENG